MSVRQHVTVHSLRCLETSLLEIISRMKQSSGPGSSLQKLWDLIRTDYILQYTKMMMKRSKSGIRRWEFRQNVSSVLVRKITSGSTVQVHVVRVLRSTMTVEKNTDVENRDVQ